MAVMSSSAEMSTERKMNDSIFLFEFSFCQSPPEPEYKIHGSRESGHNFI